MVVSSTRHEPIHGGSAAASLPQTVSESTIRNCLERICEWAHANAPVSRLQIGMQEK